MDSLWAQETVSNVPANRDEIIHVLNRITFGPRPGDVEAVQKMGLHEYIERQLHPDAIDDSVVEQQVAQFEILQMTPQELSEVFTPGLKKKKGVAPNVQGTQSKTIAQASQNMSQTATTMQSQASDDMDVPDDKPTYDQSKAAIGELEDAKLVRAIYSERQLQEVLVDFWSNHFNVDVKKGPDRVYKVVDDRDVIRPHIWGRFRDLLEASAKSPAMLYYLDNASNTIVRTLSPKEQDMQDRYLESILGLTPITDLKAPLQPPKIKDPGGNNENYAREVMELHTLGVNGGYTQKDVQEVARCFTGWTINNKTGEFTFNASQHDNSPKIVLGHKIPAGGGIKDGETVLDILCTQPSCAHFISRKLCIRFVSDDPPPALVDRIAGVFTQTDGDLRRVTEAILTSPEFLSPANYNNKIKSPLEFAVSAVRASESTITFDKNRAARDGNGILGRIPGNESKRQSLNWQIYKLGEPLFACTPPTGYKEISKFWVSPGTLIERINFAAALTRQEISDIHFDPKNILAGIDLDKPQTVLDRCIAALLQNNVTESTRQVLEKAAIPPPDKNQKVDTSKLVALIIGSPEFQKK